ncbi:putative folylpolyglutamate synthetase [Ostreococcus tauri]|uniref:Folylpolyglutamate synthase n=1 Tax=Ostreococcus tauri TaxID=70448 RepID=A0A1Y5ILG3_OSTTA|nr:putative folylpolyglutamate synthetase [Ostreococcus tauri]
MRGDASFDAAVRQLGRTITGKKRADPGAMTWEAQFDQLGTYVRRLGLDGPSDALRVIHVAGTKGKGSTCAMAERCLREAGTRCGTFTSPHLVDVRERFRVDGEPVSREAFAREFWWMHDALEGSCGDLGMPAYFRFLTLLGLRIFSEAKVEACVLEVGLGGRLDATNVIRKPVVCGISSLGMDHTDILGDTLEKIATEKAGIMKPGARVFTSPQKPEAMAALERRAKEVGCELVVIKSLDDYKDGEEIEVSLAGPHQRENASLAVALVREWANVTKQPWATEMEASFQRNELPAFMRRGLAKTVWPGRSQVIDDPDEKNLTFFLDGAHTVESMRHSAVWFAKSATRGVVNSASSHDIMMFNCMEDRKPHELLEPVDSVFSASNVSLEQTIFTPPDSSTGGLDKSALAKATPWQEKCAREWDEIRERRATLTSWDAPSSSRGIVMPSIQQALGAIRQRAREVAPARVNVLVTGSLYLVGDVLRHLRRLA